MGKLLDRHTNPDSPKPQSGKSIAGFAEAFGYLSAGAGVVCIVAAGIMMKSDPGQASTLLLVSLPSIASGIVLLGVSEGLKRLRSISAELDGLRRER